MTEPLIPASMKAVQLNGFGGPDVLQLTERPVPVAGPGEVLIRVAAAGVNRPDIAQRQGLYPPPPGAPDLPGLEVAGEIVTLGSGVSDLTTGQAVMALVAGGGYAEFCAAPAVQCLPVPDGFDLVSAAAVPETFFTVWSNLFRRGRLQPGESVLIHGGSSGIGTTAIQLARQFGARVLTTVGNDDKAAACRELGADLVINYREEDFVQAALAATEGRGVDVILDMVCGDYVNRNLACLAAEGRLVQIALMGGTHAEVDFARLMAMRHTITGSTLRPRSVAEKGSIAAALQDKVLPLLAQAKVKPIIHRVFPLAEARAAHVLMESGAHIGKIVLTT